MALHEYHLNCRECHKDFWSEEAFPSQRVCFRCAKKLLSMYHSTLETIAQKEPEPGPASKMLADPLAHIDHLAVDNQSTQLREQLAKAQNEISRLENAITSMRESSQISTQIMQRERDTATIKAANLEVDNKSLLRLQNILGMDMLEVVSVSRITDEVDDRMRQLNELKKLPGELNEKRDWWTREIDRITGEREDARRERDAMRVELQCRVDREREVQKQVMQSFEVLDLDAFPVT